MSVTIQNLLLIDLFKDAEIVAGKSGLNNEIGRINFADCPMPENIRDEALSGLIKKGDLFINSFYIVKENEEELYNFVKTYIDCECSGTFVITEYISKLPKKVIDLCNANNFPVVFIDSDIPYADIIKTTMEMILIDKSETIHEMKLEKILENDASKEFIISTAHDIIKSFKTYYASFYTKLDDFDVTRKQIFLSNIKNIKGIEPVIYKNGIFLLMNFDSSSSLDIYYNQIKPILRKFIADHHIGISNDFTEIECFNDCLKQSVLAYEVSHILDSEKIYYKDVHVYKILHPFKNSKVLKDFYSDIFDPLIGAEGSSDKNELINTIEAYLNCDGDYKKAAALIKQHENTVRYRISKAKRFLNLENDNFKFIEQVSIALKIKNLLKL
ncbi:MAG: PucR family transcriptional regulator [Caldisericia bacterium]|nr:PucR family transcriptional regulator [Caldisericia bacterium]